MVVEWSSVFPAEPSTYPRSKSHWYYALSLSGHSFIPWQCSSHRMSEVKLGAQGSFCAQWTMLIDRFSLKDGSMKMSLKFNPERVFEKEIGAGAVCQAPTEQATVLWWTENRHDQFLRDSFDVPLFQKSSLRGPQCELERYCCRPSTIVSVQQQEELIPHIPHLLLVVLNPRCLSIGHERRCMHSKKIVRWRCVLITPIHTGRWHGTCTRRMQSYLALKNLLKILQIVHIQRVQQIFEGVLLVLVWTPWQKMQFWMDLPDLLKKETDILGFVTSSTSFPKLWTKGTSPTDSPHSNKLTISVARGDEYFRTQKRRRQATKVFGIPFPYTGASVWLLPWGPIHTWIARQMSNESVAKRLCGPLGWYRGNLGEIIHMSSIDQRSAFALWKNQTNSEQLRWCCTSDRRRPKRFLCKIQQRWLTRMLSGFVLLVFSTPRAVCENRHGILECKKEMSLSTGWTVLAQIVTQKRFLKTIGECSNILFVLLSENSLGIFNLPISEMSWVTVWVSHTRPKTHSKLFSVHVRWFE